MAKQTDNQEHQETGNLDEQTNNNLQLLGADLPDDENEGLEQSFQDDEARSAEEEAAERAARAGAQMAVSFAKTLTRMKYPYVEIDETSEVQVVDKTTAVLRKYGGGLPPWLEPYREEIELGMVLAGVGFGVYAQVAAHEAEEEKKAEQAKQEHQQREGETGTSEHEVA